MRPAGRGIPHEFTEALERLAKELDLQKIKQATLADVFAQMDLLSPRLVAEAERAIQRHGRLSSVYWVARRKSWLAALFTRPRIIRGAWQNASGQYGFVAYATPDADLKLLAREQRLASIFLSHRNGYVREAALRALPDQPVSPFVFASIAFRLNDWVPEVREAAGTTLARIQHVTDARTIALAAPALLSNSTEWKRWSEVRSQFAAVLSRPDVMSEIVDRLQSTIFYGASRVLRFYLPNPAIDPFLAGLTSAKAPAIRAAAFEALISGVVRWPVGWRYRWIDKSVGRQDRMLDYATRPVSIQVPAERLLALATHDKSATVRKVLADLALAGRVDVVTKDHIINELRNDRSASIRERIAFAERTTDVSA